MTVRAGRIAGVGASGGRLGVVVVLLAALAASGCGARWAYRQGQREVSRGNWDLAVARLTRALEKDPDNIEYRIALEKARFQASRFHYAEARKHLAAGNLEGAVEELDIAVKYDPANKVAADELLAVRGRIAAREEEKRRLSDFEAMRARVQAVQLPVPVLSPRSTAPIVLKFQDQSLQKVFEALGKVAGVNVLFDPDFRDKRVDVNLTGVTFQQALDQLTFGHRLFYKVLDPNTLIIVPESAAKRRVYDDVLLRTFYIQNAEIKEIEAIVKPLLGTSARVVSNPSLGALTVVGTIDQLALAERLLELNDKARGEVLVDVEILEINRNKLRDYGINLANYEARAILSPTGAEGEVAGDLTTVRAHLLSSLNLADFVVSIPAGLFAKFLQTSSNVRILASPRLRASEGKPATLSIGTEVPIPITTFTAATAGTATFAPATSFQYRNVGVNLKITPRVNAAGEITLELAAEFSLLGEDRRLGTGENALSVPTFLSRKVEGVLRVRDGETSLIGGLLQSRDADSLSGALGLLDVPIVNKIFSARKKTRDDTEVLISITPHLVRAPSITEGDLRSLYVGTQEAVRVPSARPPLFGTPEEPVSMGPGPAPEGPPAAPPTTPPTEAPPPTEPPAPTPAPPRAPEAAPPVTAPGGLRPLSASLSPSEATLRVGETASISVVLMNARDLTGLELLVSYDPALIEAIDVTAGTLLTMDGAAVGIDRGLEAGRVRARLTRATARTGSGIVAGISFRGLRPGPALITVESLSVISSTGTEPAGVPGPARMTVVP